LAESDNRIAFGASGRLVFWRVLQLLKVVLVRATVHIHLGLEILPALWTSLPVARVLFGVVITTQRIAAVIPVTTISGVGEQYVLIFVITDPLPTTLRLG
jgi:hypothetical protein